MPVCMDYSSCEVRVWVVTPAPGSSEEPGFLSTIKERKTSKKKLFLFQSKGLKVDWK